MERKSREASAGREASGTAGGDVAPEGAVRTRPSRASPRIGLLDGTVADTVHKVTTTRGDNLPTSRLLPVALALLVLSACSTSEGKTTSTASSSTGRSAPTSSATASSLSGFGAGEDAWDAKHGPHTALGVCCYGPMITVVDSSAPMPTWFSVDFGGNDVANQYSRRFTLHTSEQSAVAAIVADDLPADARQTSKGIAGTCEVLKYHSNTLNDSGAVYGGDVGVLLHPKPGAATFDPENVVTADLEAAGLVQGDCA